METLLLMTFMGLGLGEGGAPQEPAAIRTTADLVFSPGQALALPTPTTTGGMPLLTALSNRHSAREYEPAALPLAVLSDLLWAANGVNRKAVGKRTAATARNWQSLDVYVVTAGGTFRYDPDAHALVPARPGDLRAATGRQPFVADVPVNLVYVSDRTRLVDVSDEADKTSYDGVHAGIVAENVYLFAASAGLATVVRANLDKAALARAMGLRETQRVVLAQSVGYPKVPGPTGSWRGTGGPFVAGHVTGRR